MKIIDLLNKIAKGEEVPKKIKYIEEIFVWNEDFCDYESDCFLHKINSSYLFRGLFVQNMSYMNKYNLNDEVEIKEEEKEIEKLNLDTDKLRGKETVRAIDYLLEGKINELIDVINDMRDKE